MDPNTNTPDVPALDSPAAAPPEDRFSRQRDLVPADMLADLTITVIGTGAVGRHLALNLAAMGAQSLCLIDHDKIELTNVTTQGWPVGAIGQYKVSHLAEEIQKIEPNCLVAAVPKVFAPSRLPFGWETDPLNQVFFVAVDSISVRAQIWAEIHESVQFLADGRMLEEFIRIFTVDGTPARKELYAKSLFAQEEAIAGRCTARSTIYSATICAGLMLHQFARWLRGTAPTDPDLYVDLPGTSMEPTPAPIEDNTSVSDSGGGLASLLE